MKFQRGSRVFAFVRMDSYKHRKYVAFDLLEHQQGKERQSSPLNAPTRFTSVALAATLAMEITTTLLALSSGMISISLLLQNGAFGTALMSVTANAKVKISPFVATLAKNPTFVSGFCALAAAQCMKVLLNFCVEKKWDFRIMFGSCGMPSSHSALCTTLTTLVGICHGVADSLFPVCLGFSLIVMYDAIGVRRHAGMQADVVLFVLVVCCLLVLVLLLLLKFGQSW